MCNVFVFCLKKQDIFYLEKAVLISILYHLFILMFIYIHRFVIKIYIYKTLVIIGHATFCIVKIIITYLSIDC